VGDAVGDAVGYAVGDAVVGDAVGDSVGLIDGLPGVVNLKTSLETYSPPWWRNSSLRWRLYELAPFKISKVYSWSAQMSVETV